MYSQVKKRVLIEWEVERARHVHLFFSPLTNLCLCVTVTIFGKKLFLQEDEQKTNKFLYKEEENPVFFHINWIHTQERKKEGPRAKNYSGR